ncbi:unnamed protein product [Dicrocoelium dendriticum]|nr:unnamed protein product [Dicrocoelium dendriticum]
MDRSYRSATKIMSHSSKHHIEVSSVALVDLKAEISRRQIEVKQRAQQLPEGCTVIKNNSADSNAQRKSIWRKQKPETEEVHSLTLSETDATEQDSLRLEQSRRKLEAKAKLYEALKAAAMSGPMSHSKSRLHPQDDDGLLVDFEKKIAEDSKYRSASPVRSIDSDHSDEDAETCPAAHSDDEWEEYTDSQGIKRMCMRKDRKSMENREPPIRSDGPLTYAHLREGEIRDHGVGFYAFSEDAEQREAEMARLKELHRITEEGRARAQIIRAKRDARMGQRLARLRARKGMPDVATAAAQCLAETSAPPTPLPVSADAQSDIRLSSEDLDVASMLRRLRNEAELRASLNETSTTAFATQPNSMKPSNLADILESNRTVTSREWDRGKSMISAQRYIQEERERRLPEFAPPSFY